jgi:hypothetical protein
LDTDGDGVLKTTQEKEMGILKNELVEVWRNGELLVDHKFSDIRARAEV